MSTLGTEHTLRERADFVCDSVGSLLTVRIRGEIDHHTAAFIRQGVDALLYERKPKKLMLDLSAVTFMDSSGLGLIMGRYALVRELGGELVVWNPGRETCAVLQLAGMERMVKIEYPASANPAQGQATARQPSSSKRTSPAASRKRRNTTRKEKDA